MCRSIRAIGGYPAPRGVERQHQPHLAEIANWRWAGAVGVAGARQKLAEGSADRATPIVSLGCAHAAKFPDAVEAAAGVRPPLPMHLADLFERRERTTVVENDLGRLQALIEDRRPA